MRTQNVGTRTTAAGGKRTRVSQNASCTDCISLEGIPRRVRQKQSRTCTDLRSLTGLAASRPHASPTSGVSRCSTTSCRHVLSRRWVDYTPFGETVADTRIIAVKTPLEQVSQPPLWRLTCTYSRGQTQQPAVFVIICFQRCEYFPVNTTPY